MNRAEKAAAIDRIHADFEVAPHVILTDYRGLTANQSSELRRRIRAAGGSYQVIKNRLAKRAATGTGAEKVRDRFQGTCAVALHRTDPVGLAKVLTDFAKENPQLKLTAAVIDAREVLQADGLKALAALPGINELRAQILAVIQTPATQLLRLLSTPGAQLARAVDARREKLEGKES